MEQVKGERLQRAREFSDQMLSWARGRGKILIVVHDNPDPDCLASAMALRHLFIMKLGEEPVIAFSGIIARSENLAMARELEIPLKPLGILELHEFKVICMLDTQPATGNNSFPEDVRIDLVIDHHPLREQTKLCRWVDVRANYGVTATILYEYLLAQELTISTKLATAIFYAIKSDTQDLGREADLPDREAYLNLFPLMNKRLLYQITNPRQPMEYFSVIRRTLDKAVIYDRVMVANLGKVAFPEMVAEMADFLLRLEGIEAVLTMGHYCKEVALSLRTLSPALNAGEIITRLVIGYGTAGGHALMAGGKIGSIPETEAAMEQIERLLTCRFLEETGCSTSVGKMIN